MPIRYPRRCLKATRGPRGRSAATPVLFRKPGRSADLSQSTLWGTGRSGTPLALTRFRPTQHESDHMPRGEMHGEEVQ